MNSNKTAVIALCVAFLALGIAIAALYTANKNSFSDVVKDSMKMMEKYDPSQFNFGPVPTAQKK